MSRRSEDRKSGTDRQEPVSLTSVPEPRSDEIDRRWHVYAIQMTVRIACFIGAVFARGPFQIVLIVGAVVLPYTAVIFANAGGERRSTALSEVDLPELPSAPTAAPPTVIEQVDTIVQDEPLPPRPDGAPGETPGAGDPAPGQHGAPEDRPDDPGPSSGGDAHDGRTAA